MADDEGKKSKDKDVPLSLRPADPWTTFFNESIPWHKLPDFLALVRIFRIRDLLRKRNLHDTSGAASPSAMPRLDPSVRHRDVRTVDGTFNDLDNPHMGAVNTRFGRNVPLEHTIPEREPGLLSPSPRLVSNELLARDTFKPATILNLLAAAWIQFEVHDWFSHGKNAKENAFQIPLAENDSWPEGKMEIRRTGEDPTRNPVSTDPVPTFVNTETHWWDASQIYGSTAEVMSRIRSFDGKLLLGDNGLLPLDPEKGVDDTGVNGNWWLGLSLLHTLFTYEHNAISDRLRQSYPGMSDDDVFQKARLVNSALIAKIHTVDWTPAILPHSATAFGVPANWWGLRGEQKLRERGRFTNSDIISGIPGTETDHHGVPFAITEEFVSVYRMHPLMPDQFAFHKVADNSLLFESTLEEVMARKVRPIMEQHDMADLFYSFGIAHPGAVTLHNFPETLRRLVREDGPTIDLAAVDVMRDRERGVPRYNAFRRLIHLDPVDNFEELTDNAEWREQIRKVYENDINRVDLMVGLYSEPIPEGLGFSDTAFRIFILMATRRLKSDRFLSEDYGPDLYTEAGIEWLETNNMKSVLLRHFPQLSPAMGDLDNAFQPWRKTGP